MKNKELSYVISIIYTSLFLIISTLYWYHNIYGIRDNAMLDKFQENQIMFVGTLNKVSEDKIEELTSYSLNLKNSTNDVKKIKVYVANKNYNSELSNNYVKFQINDEYINTLNMDGLVYCDDVLGNQEKQIKIKLWISNTYQGNNSYDPVIIIN